MERYTIKNIDLFKLNDNQKESINKFNNSLNESSYEKLSSCNVCGLNSFVEISNIDCYGLKRPTLLCKECGYLFANPKLNDVTHKRYYENFYRENDRDFKVPSKEFYELEKHRGVDIINYISSNIKLNRDFSCLDVGCGSGATSFIFANIFKDVTAIDLAKEYTKNVEQLDNLKVLHTTIHDGIFDNKKFGFINYCHVFEHINDPIKELNRIKEILNKDGYLYIEVPGIYHVDHWYDGNFFHSLEMDHTHFFTLTTLKNMMIKNGFELVCGNEIIKSVWKVSNSNENYIFLNECFF